MPDVTRTVEIRFTEDEIKSALALYAENYKPTDFRLLRNADVELIVSPTDKAGYYSVGASVQASENDE